MYRIDLMFHNDADEGISIATDINEAVSFHLSVQSNISIPMSDRT